MPVNVVDVGTKGKERSAVHNCAVVTIYPYAPSYRLLGAREIQSSLSDEFPGGFPKGELHTVRAECKIRHFQGNGSLVAGQALRPAAHAPAERIRIADAGTWTFRLEILLGKV